MSVSNGPLVSVVTPVYNLAPFIGQCIESVWAQTYTNWEYTIVDNCSTDGTRAIAEKYALQDKRIKVHANETFLDIIANHNKAFGLISPVSKYCKQVSGDDWILPQCLERMVEIAEKNASVGIVGSYQVSGGGDLWCLRTYGLPYGVSAFSGREIGRLQLLGKLDVLGNPTSNFYRSDIVRTVIPFSRIKPQKRTSAHVTNICGRWISASYTRSFLTKESIPIKLRLLLSVLMRTCVRSSATLQSMVPTI